jgi:hypothetical protein
MSEGACPQAHRHTKCPSGHVAWHDWAESKSVQHYQARCRGCGRFAIWKRHDMRRPTRMQPVLRLVKGGRNG